MSKADCPPSHGWASPNQTEDVKGTKKLSKRKFFLPDCLSWYIIFFFSCLQTQWFGSWLNVAVLTWTQRQSVYAQVLEDFLCSVSFLSDFDTFLLKGSTRAQEIEYCTEVRFPSHSSPQTSFLQNRAHLKNAKSERWKWGLTLLQGMESGLLWAFPDYFLWVTSGQVTPSAPNLLLFIMLSYRS